MNRQAREVMQNMLEEAFAPEITPNNKFWCLLALGFESRRRDMWHHRFFGEDREDNWIRFNLRTDDLHMVIVRTLDKGAEMQADPLSEKFKRLYEL